jgi:hypothetical protein
MGRGSMPNDDCSYARIGLSSRVEFKARIADLRNAVAQLAVNGGERRPPDFVDVLVSECITTFRTVGTSAEIAVNGISPGTARIPLSTVEKIAAVAKTFKGRETSVSIWEGLIKIGSWQTRNPEIVLGVIPDLNLDIPSDASFLDTLALAWLLSPAGVEGQGLQRRVTKAMRAKEDAIDRATRALEPLRVEREKIAALVEEHISEASKLLRGILPK